MLGAHVEDGTRATRRLRLGVAAVAIAVIATGWAIRRATHGLGTSTPPFVAGWLPKVDPVGLGVAVVALCGAVVLGPRLLDRRLSPLAFGAASYMVSLGVGGTEVISGSERVRRVRCPT